MSLAKLRLEVQHWPAGKDCATHPMQGPVRLFSLEHQSRRGSMPGRQKGSIGGQLGTRAVGTLLFTSAVPASMVALLVGYERHRAGSPRREAGSRKGWRVSAGLEHRLVGHALVTGEHRYSD